MNYYRHPQALVESERIGDNTRIWAFAHVLSGAVIGLGANVIEELVIGTGAVVAAGAVVTKDVQDKTLVAGVPAVFKKTYED